VKFIDSSINKNREPLMTLRQTARTALLGTAVTFALAGSAFAEGCDKIIFSDVGWTDITATTAATSLIAEALGYETETKVLSVSDPHQLGRREVHAGHQRGRRGTGYL